MMRTLFRTLIPKQILQCPTTPDIRSRPFRQPDRIRRLGHISRDLRQPGSHTSVSAEGDLVVECGQFAGIPFAAELADGALPQGCYCWAACSRPRTNPQVSPSPAPTPRRPRPGSLLPISLCQDGGAGSHWGVRANAVGLHDACPLFAELTTARAGRLQPGQRPPSDGEGATASRR